jgi:hypothetical protein
VGGKILKINVLGIVDKLVLGNMQHWEAHVQLSASLDIGGANLGAAQGVATATEMSRAVELASDNAFDALKKKIRG